MHILRNILTCAAVASSFIALPAMAIADTKGSIKDHIMNVGQAYNAYAKEMQSKGCQISSVNVPRGFGAGPFAETVLRFAGKKQANKEFYVTTTLFSTDGYDSITLSQAITDEYGIIPCDDEPVLFK